MKEKYLKALATVTAAFLLSSLTACASETDQRIESSVKQSYVFKTYLKNDSINTKVKDGIVTLTGTVTQESHKSLAQETVASVRGVKSVDNQLLYKGERHTENSDGWIGVQVKTSLLFNRYVSGLRTQVFVEKGIVTLKGEAENQAQKDLAGEYARDIKGVKDVFNQMSVAKIPMEPKKTIDEKIDDASITAQVKMAFFSHQSTSALNTGVETNNGIVTLSGIAGSGAGIGMATKVAADVYGVIKVVNNMTVRASI